MTLRPARLWLALGILAAPALPAQTPPANVVRPAPPPPNVPRQVPPSGNQAVSKSTGDTVDSFKLSDGDIDSVLSALETFTGRTVVRPGQLPTAAYSLKITRPIPKAELVTALETLLALNGVSVSPMGERFLKVTALSQAKSESPEMITGSSLDLPPSGRIVTKLFELNFLRVSELVPQIQLFMTPGIGNGIVQLEKANVALVTDSLENIQRIERLLIEVDKPREDSLTPKFYGPLINAKASDVVAKIHSMLSGPAQNQLRATTTFTADDRTNQIVVIADPREYPLFNSLISQLDIKSDPNTRNEVIYLKHADAKDVSTLLSALISGQNAAAQKSGSQVQKVGSATTPGTPPATGQPAAAAGGADTFANNGTTEFSTMVTIQPDERTNSIVVSGTAADLSLIQSIVDKIDILLTQVRIEVVIAEVTFDDSSNSGINTSATSGPSVAIGQGGTILGATGSVAGLSVTSLAQLAQAATSATTTVSGTTATALTPVQLAAAAGFSTFNPLNAVASLSSLGAISKTKILQESTIVTTHNKEATITVTDELPVITGTTAEPVGVATSVTSSTFAQSNTVTYKDIGITLKVTPLIGDDGSIQLKVDQTVDDQGTPVTINGNSQPQINHREATSFVNVMNDELVVLGGFQSSSKSISRQRFGVLYEIPILSNLLGYRTNDTTRTELLLFLRPHVIKEAEGTRDTKRAVNGMGNKDQINDYLANPERIPDAQMSMKERLK
jgi:general secretion pathway protein D